MGMKSTGGPCRRWYEK